VRIYVRPKNKKVCVYLTYPILNPSLNLEDFNVILCFSNCQLKVKVEIICIPAVSKIFFFLQLVL